MLRVRVAFTSTIGGGPYLATHYFTHGDAALDAQAAVDAVGAFWGVVDANMDNQVSWATETEVAVMTLAGEITGSHATTPQTGTGALVEESLPLATQALVRWMSATFVGGRRIRGRTFIPGLTEGANNNGRLTSSVQTNINSAATNLITNASTQLAVWSRVHGAAPTVSSASTWTEFATLRSRRD